MKSSGIILSISLIFLGSFLHAEIQKSQKGRNKKMVFELSSPAFLNGQMMPPKYSCDGLNVSPPLQWTDPPQGVKSFALINDDPDAPSGDWVHWVIYNIPQEVRSLQENFSNDAKLKDGTLQGMTDFGRIAFGGPCPPSGTHRYFFKLYALDIPLSLKSGASKDDLLQAMKGYILAETELIGKYRRQGR